MIMVLSQMLLFA